jgi:oligoendopeptidase F
MPHKELPLRKDIPESCTWDLSSAFASIEAWETAYGEVEKSLRKLEDFKDTLSESPQNLVNFLRFRDELTNKMAIIEEYAYLNFAVESTNQTYSALAGKAQGLFAKFKTALAFAEPELIAIGFKKLNKWLDENSELLEYSHYFDKLSKQAAHVQTTEIEALLGNLSDAFQTSKETHGLLANADMSIEPAKTAGGESLEVSHSNILSLQLESDRELRRSSWQNYADAHLTYRNTMANCLAAGVKQDVFMSRARKYDSALEAALAPSDLPVSVYHNVVGAFKKNLPVWHRYWELRKRVLGLDEIHIYDTRARLTENLPEINFEQAVDWIYEGIRILGDDYAAIARKGALEERWVDWCPNKGKRFGAFSAGMPGTKPFIMMSFNNDMLGLSTLAHELGHSMHSYLTFENQPLINSYYSLFVAEVASNFHQAVVRAHLLETLTDRDMQIAIIEEAMANFYRYFFIMPSLSIFDLEIHQMVERGEPLTAENMIDLMGNIFADGYGPNVVVDKERIGSTWMQFSTHLYSNFYTYQYTTGIAAAHSLSEKVLAGLAVGDTTARDNYLAFLRSGDSLYPLDALKLAGVDLTTPEPVDKTFKVLSGMIDRLETLVG